MKLPENKVFFDEAKKVQNEERKKTAAKWYAKNSENSIKKAQEWAKKNINVVKERNKKIAAKRKAERWAQKKTHALNPSSAP